MFVIQSHRQNESRYEFVTVHLFSGSFLLPQASSTVFIRVYSSHLHQDTGICIHNHDGAFNRVKICASIYFAVTCYPSTVFPKNGSRAPKSFWMVG